MRFVKFKGENGQDVFVNPLWVHAVELVVGVGPSASTLFMVGGDEVLVRGTAHESVSALTGEPQNLRRMRSVGEQ